MKLTNKIVFDKYYTREGMIASILCHRLGPKCPPGEHLEGRINQFRVMENNINKGTIEASDKEKKLIRSLSEACMNGIQQRCDNMETTNLNTFQFILKQSDKVIERFLNILGVEGKFINQIDKSGCH